MITRPDERRPIDIAFWIFAGLCLLVILTSCSPYTAAPPKGPTPGGTAVTVPPMAATVTATRTPRPDTCKVNGTVYLRPGPSKAGAPLAILRAGDRLEVIQRGAWLFVSTRQTTGFIYSRYCEIGE